MKISFNASAVIANNSLTRNDNRLQESLARLSSGLKVVNAKDNPSGLAMSKRMNAQIEGINQATQNAGDGVSIIEIADGTLAEIHDMLQRLNELCVKASTGTLSDNDRELINDEARQLKEEITRIAEEAEFNGQNILDGSFDLKGYTDNQNVKVTYYSDQVMSGTYELTALNVTFADDGTIDEVTAFTGGNGFPADAKVDKVDGNIVTITGSQDFELKIRVTKPDTEDFTFVTPVNGTDYNSSFNVTFNEDGTIKQVNNLSTAIPDCANPPVYTVNGNTVTIEDNNGNSYDFTLATDTFSITDTTLDLVGFGSMDMQIGANEGQQLGIRIPRISLENMGISSLDLTTQKGAEDALGRMDGAINYVSSVRSRLGAYQNRLEHTVSSLDITSENMTAAYSRIMDVDMAEEMTEYTTLQVLSQASTSMLAQANERPAQVLQLLQ